METADLRWILVVSRDVDFGTIELVADRGIVALTPLAVCNGGFRTRGDLVVARRVELETAVAVADLERERGA